METHVPTWRAETAQSPVDSEKGSDDQIDVPDHGPPQTSEEEFEWREVRRGTWVHTRSPVPVSHAVKDCLTFRLGSQDPPSSPTLSPSTRILYFCEPQYFRSRRARVD